MATNKAPKRDRGNQAAISRAGATAADPEKRAALGTPKFLAGPQKVATPVKKSRSQMIIDRSSGTPDQLSDTSLAANVKAGGNYARPSDVRANRPGYESHFNSGVYHPEK